MLSGELLIQLGASCRVSIEVPRWGFVKRRADGGVDFVSPIPCPYNYGSILGLVAPDLVPLAASASACARVSTLTELLQPVRIKERHKKKMKDRKFLRC
jgi:hypothetical protein